jgi:hypothetical protein
MMTCLNDANIHHHSVPLAGPPQFHSRKIVSAFWGAEPSGRRRSPAHKSAPAGHLSLRAEDLAEASAVSVATIHRAELADSEMALTTTNQIAVRHALKAAGVEFIDENGGGPGVRLRKHL